MVSEIQTEDDEMMEQLLKQGILPLDTPVEKIGDTRIYILPLHLLCISSQINSLLFLFILHNLYSSALL